MERPRTQYARSGEIAIAYQVSGSGEIDLVYSGGPASNVEMAWTMPSAARMLELLGSFARVIRFDRRDTGLSDPIKDDLTLEAHVADALAVMDATGAQRPVLLGSSDGGRALAALAATRPDRAAALIALGCTPRGIAAATPEFAAEIARALEDLDWPGPTLGLWAPSWQEDEVRRDQLERYVQATASPRQAARLLRLSLTSDVSEVLPLVQAPTLVLRARDAVAPPAGAVRAFADLIPGAVYHEVEGDGNLLYALDPDELAALVRSFATGTAHSPLTSRALATVLFTDLVASTSMAATAGDAAWARTLADHHAAVAQAVAEHGGAVLKSLGDGVLATFTGPAQGIRCAQRVTAEAVDAGLQVRAGLHTGEIERTDTDVSGLAVHLTARIMALAGSGEVLVSRTVKDLVIGSELEFEDRGEHRLKGIPDSWMLYAAV